MNATKILFDIIMHLGGSQSWADLIGQAGSFWKRQIFWKNISTL